MCPVASISPSYSYVLSSDGSGNPLLSGAAACIFEQKFPPKRGKFVAFLGPCTGNEAEIMGGLLGFLVGAEVLREGNTEQEFGNSLLWQTDSQYLIRSVEQLKGSDEKLDKMPNFPLWKQVRDSWSGFTIHTTHVRARSGNRRNEACDHASRWIQRKGKKILGEFGEGKIGRLKESVPQESWYLLDLSALLLSLRERNEQDSSKAIEELRGKIQGFLGEFS